MTYRGVWWMAEGLYLQLLHSCHCHFCGVSSNSSRLALAYRTISKKKQKKANSSIKKKKANSSIPIFDCRLNYTALAVVPFFT